MVALPQETTEEVQRKVSQRERNEEGEKEQPGREIMLIESTSDVIEKNKGGRGGSGIARKKRI